MLPQSLVAWSVIPLLKPSVGLLVSVVCPPWVTDTVTSPDREAEPAVNSIICSVAPPETGMRTLPWYWKSVKVTDPADRTEAAAGAVTADGAAACFWASFFDFDFAVAGFFALVGVPLGEGEAVADGTEGVAVPD